MTVLVGGFTSDDSQPQREPADTQRELSPVDRLELREGLKAAIALMREAASTNDRWIRTRLSKQALAELFVVVAGARLKQGSNAPIEWPELDEAARIVSALPGLAAHAAAIAFVTAPETQVAVTDPDFAALSDLFALLERRIDLRTSRDLTVARWARRSLAALLLIGCGLLAFAPTNLARGKLVTASSISGSTPEQPLGEARLARVVDGQHSEQTFAVSTDVQPDPWVTIDLGTPREVARVAVYGRNDGFWNDGAGPLEVQLSLDDAKYDSVVRRAQPVLRSYPWNARFPVKTARFVRIRGVSHAPQRITASEIEVYRR